MNESTSYRPLLPVEDLRRLRPGEGVLLYGHLRPTPIRLRPYYDPREQARRDRAEHRGQRRAARAERRLGRKTERAFNRLHATAAPAGPGDGRANRVAGAESGPPMTTDSYSAGTPADQPEPAG